MTRGMELVSVTKVIQYLEEGYDLPNSWKSITRELLTKAGKELCQYVTKTERGFKLLEDFLNALQTLVKHNSISFEFLSDNGLTDVLGDVYQNVLQRLTKDGTTEGLQVIVEMLLEVTHVLGNLHSSAKSQICQGLCPYMLDLLQADKLEFQVKMEVVKSTNMLLDQCPTGTKDAILLHEDFQKKITNIISLIKSIGDYEFQVGLVECLIRLFPRKSRQKYASQFISDTMMLDGFLNIKDREFETDCRSFLNDLNSRMDSKKSVFSIPCVAAFVGNKQLRKPSDTGYDQFWVDFNIGSQRMTLFCEQDSLLSQGTPMDEQLWETVAIYKTDILKCSCCEIQGAIILEIGLKQRVCELYPSQHQDVTDNTVRVEFELEREMEIAQAVGKTFCFTEIRNKVSTVVDPIQISIREVQEQDSQSQLQESEDPEMPYQTNMVPPASQESTARRRKVSVPSIPMRTPTSTPIIPAAKSVDSNLCERTSKKLMDQAQKVSSTTAPLKISRQDETLVESKQAHHVTETADQAVICFGDSKSANEDGKKEHRTKEAQKQLPTKQKNRNAEFAVPKTPAGVSKTSKPKVKTPVVTVTPPAASKKKTKKKSAKEPRDNEEIVLVEKVKEPDIVDPESIPDSIPTDVVDVNDLSVSKEAFCSKNTTVDSGINLDESRASNSHTTSQLKRDIAIHLNDVKDNKAYRVKGFENKRESRSKKNKKSNAENEMVKPTKHHKKKHTKSSVHTNTAIQNETDLRPKMDDQDSLLENLSAEPVQQPVSYLEDDEDKFDFDSQQDKIPDSLEPSVEPNLKSSNEKPDIVQSKQTSITEKYLKMLESKGMKSKESRQSFDCDIVNEINSKSSKDKKQNKSFTDLEPSLKDLYIADHKASSKQKQDRKSKLKSKGKEAFKTSTKAESNKNIVPLSNFGKEPKVVNSSSARQLRSRKVNKSYKEADECDSSLEEDSTDDSRKKNNVYDTAEFFNSKLDNANLTKRKEENSNDSEKDKPLNEVPKGYKKSSETLVSKAQTTGGKHDAQDGYDIHHIAEDDNVENILHPYPYSRSKHVKDTNDARSDESSDISEDYRFNNSQESLDMDRIPESHEYTDCLNSTHKQNKREEEKANIETDKACNMSADFPGKNQIKNRKGKKDTVDETLDEKDRKQKSVCEMEEMSAKSKSKSADKEFTDSVDEDPQTKVKTKKHRKTQPTTDCIEKNSSDIEKSINNDCNQKRDEKKEKAKDKKNKEGKDLKNKSVTIEQNKESIEYEDFDGHLKQCKVDSVSKKKGKGFVFQISYCRSETNYKYKNRYMPGASKSNLSSGYDPYDFTACENECVKAEVESPGMENRNSLNYKKKPRKFFKHSRSNENNESNCAYDETRINSKNQSRTSTKCDSTIEPPELNDNLVLSLTSPKEKTSKYKQKQARQYYKTVSRKQPVENNNTTDTDSAESLIISSDSPQGYNKNVKTKSKKQNITRNKRKSNKQNKESSHKKTNKDSITNAPMESNNTSVSPELSKDQTHKGREFVNKHKNKSHQSSGYDQIDNTINMESDDGSEISVNKCNSSKPGKGVKRRERKPEKVSGKSLHGATIDVTSDDSLVISPDQSKTNRLLEQDPVTKKWHRKSDLHNSMTNKAVMKAEDYSSNNHPVHKKKSRQSEKEKVKPESIDTDEIHTEIVEEVPLESDEMASQEENSFSKIVKDIVAARSGNIKSKKKHSRGKCPPEKESDDKENDNKNDDSCFKEFDTEIVDCIMEDVLKTPCVSASLASTPKVGSARRKHYNPLNISVIKTPVSLSKSVTFDDDVGGDDSEDEDKFAEKTVNQNRQRRRSRRKPVQYKDLSDEEINRDERLSQSSSRRSISSLLDSSNNISTRSEKSWILDHKKTPKPKPKTYKVHKQQKLYNSQTESSEEDEPGDRSVASRSLSGLSGALSLDIPTPSQSSVSRASKKQEDEDNLILTPVTPRKLSDTQCKAEDDIEVYQTQEDCTLSLNVNKKHVETKDMDVSEIGSICLSALGVKTPQKHPQEEVDDNADLEESAHKKLQESLKLILGDSGFASGPSSEVRPSRSTLKRKFPNIMECESGSNPLSDEESTAQIEKPSILVPKKLFKFDHSSILETMNARSDTASTCSDTLEEQEDLEYPFQSGLSSFMTAFAADIQKHLNAKKQRFEELTKGVLKSTQKKFSSTWLEQQQYQSSVTEDFQAKMMAELAHLESDIVKMKEIEMKSEEFFKNQLEILHSSYISQTTRHSQKLEVSREKLANLKKMHSSYRDRARKVQKYNSAAHNNMVDQLRKEMTALQKKLVQETQKQELMNVRRGLQNLF